ncbi:MAG: hypothetical protein M3N46_01120, partial [Actinomycetota bacterium]|nr:hypothetical protein [Actinomycetota bacterium]
MADRREKAGKSRTSEWAAAAIRRAPRGQTRGGPVSGAGSASRSSLRRQQRLRPSLRGIGTALVGILAFFVAYG